MLNHGPDYQNRFGTALLKGDALLKAMESALQVGYRAFDAAPMYDNQDTVGEALAGANLSRHQLFLTTKVHLDCFEEASFFRSVEDSLADLRVDSVDLLLLHWPPEDGNVVPSLRLLERALDRKLTRQIGVSNYTIEMLETAKRVVDAPIATNQVEFHPLLDQRRLLQAANRLGIELSAYCPLARGEVLKEPMLQRIGQRYGKTAGQTALRWILQKGVTINALSSNPEHIRSNFEIMDFALTDEEMCRIDSLNSTNYRIVSKTRVPHAPDFD